MNSLAGLVVAAAAGVLAASFDGISPVTGAAAGIVVGTVAWFVIQFIRGAVHGLVTIVYGMTLGPDRLDDEHRVIASHMCAGIDALAIVAVGFLIYRWL